MWTSTRWSRGTWWTRWQRRKIWRSWKRKSFRSTSQWWKMPTKGAASWTRWRNSRCWRNLKCLKSNTNINSFLTLFNIILRLQTALINYKCFILIDLSLSKRMMSDCYWFHWCFNHCVYLHLRCIWRKNWFLNSTTFDDQQFPQIILNHHDGHSVHFESQLTTRFY